MASIAARRCRSSWLTHAVVPRSVVPASTRYAMMSATAWTPSPSASTSERPAPSSSNPSSLRRETSSIPLVIPTDKTPLSAEPASPQTAAPPPPVPRPERLRPAFKAKKAALSITPDAVERLRALLRSPTPQLLRVGVRNKGCAGLSYHLEYVDKPAKFDEVVDQDGVKVVIDSKALFSIIGSEMDWQEDALSSKFVFNNPNITDACGCGESFTVGS